MFDDQVLLSNALVAWQRHHRMTYSLLEQLDEKLLYAEVLKPDLTSFAKHFEEMAAVQGAYAEALHSGKLDFSRLPRDREYQGKSSKIELKAGLENADHLIEQGIRACPAQRVIEIFGNQGSRVDLIHTMLHHELFHHGMFAVYAFELKFDLPVDWREFWWIPVMFESTRGK